jgi:chromosome partitioning protein
MATVITLANQKGGVGKTAICVNLAHAFKESVSTALVDLDPQGSALQTASKMSGVNVYPYNNNFTSLKEQVVFVDTPPYLHENLISILEQSDLIIIPIRAGIWDVLATEGIVNIVKDIQKKRSNVLAVILLNMVNMSTTLTAEAEDALKEFDLPILKTRIAERVCFGRSASFPDGIYSLGDKKAINEINDLTKEILFLLKT